MKNRPLCSQTICDAEGSNMKDPTEANWSKAANVTIVQIKEL